MGEGVRRWVGCSLSIEDFIDRNSRLLLRSAWLLTGNWASAEDLVQTSLLQSWLQERDQSGYARLLCSSRPDEHLPQRAAASVDS
jgi:hypothetical protein